MASRDYIKHFVSTTAPKSSTLGDEWFNPATNVLYKRVANNGKTAMWVASLPAALPTATINTLGLVKVGANLTVDNGVLSAMAPPSAGVSTGKAIAMAIVFG